MATSGVMEQTVNSWFYYILFSSNQRFKFLLILQVHQTVKTSTSVQTGRGISISTTYVRINSQAGGNKKQTVPFRHGGFLKWGIPRHFHEMFHQKNNPFGVPPMETPIWFPLIPKKKCRVTSSLAVLPVRIPQPQYTALKPRLQWLAGLWN